METLIIYQRALKLVYLRAFELTDLERTYKWHNDPGLYESVCGAYRYISRTSEKEWLENKSAFSNTELNLAICLTENDEHIGNVFVRNIDWISRSCNSAGAMIGNPEYRSKGYIQAAFLLFYRHVFRDLGLNRLEVQCLVENKSIQYIAEKFNHKKEGLLRQIYFKDGDLKDAYIYSLLAKDFFELEVRLEDEAKAVVGESQ